MQNLNHNEIKRKLRDLKKLELRIRFPNYRQISGELELRLVWRIFFTLDDRPSAARYSISDIIAMSHEEYRAVVDEFLVTVYIKSFSDRGTALTDFNPDILSELGLPCDADSDQIKARFRELAKIHHPDAGGDPADFIAFMERYRALINKGGA